MAEPGLAAAARRRLRLRARRPPPARAAPRPGRRGPVRARRRHPGLGRGPRRRLRHRRREPGGRVRRRASTSGCALGFGRCRLVLAAPAASPIDAAPATSPASAIATSYPATVGRYLAARGIAATCIPITGSVELAPSLDAAEAIADLVSSGETLRQNGLVELETIARVGGRAARAAPSSTRATEARVAELVLVLRSVLAARPKRYLMLNAHDEQLDGHRRPPPRPRCADRAAAGARRHARRARCRRRRRGRPAARAPQAGRRHRHPRPPDRAPDPMTLSDDPLRPARAGPPRAVPLAGQRAARPGRRGST